jgi:hypothetical protein
MDDDMFSGLYFFAAGAGEVLLGEESFPEFTCV